MWYATYVNSSVVNLLVQVTACSLGTELWDTINSGPRDPRTREPKDLQLLRETEIQLQAKTHGCITAWIMQVSLAQNNWNTFSAYSIIL